MIRRYERLIPTLALLAGTSLLGGCGPPRPTVPFAQLEPPDLATVRPGDVVAIEFWEQEALSGDRIVDEHGRIHLPILRGVEVVGLSAQEIRTELTELYRQYYSDPLIVLNVRLGVNVTGAIVKPGRYTVDPAYSILDLIGLAGGLQNVAKRDALELNREGKRFAINLNEAQLLTQVNKLRLQSGDWLYVPTRFWTLQRTLTYATLAVLILSVATFFK